LNKIAASMCPSRSLTFAPLVQRRTIFGFGRPSKSTGPNKPSPLTEEYLTRKPKAPQGGIVKGKLSESSIFEDEHVAGPKKAVRNAGKQEDIVVRDPHIMAAALDPRPEARRRWEAKMTIREITRRGRLTRAQILKRTEREVHSKSHNIKTSVKKLGPLARQIAGKTVEEAILQMRFSKKKAAAEVRKHLEHAKNEAIVRRGMGLSDAGKILDKPVTVMTNKGKRVKITDPTTLYVDQAWVGKGDYGTEPDYRARGQIHIMKNPTTRKFIFQIFLQQILILDRPCCDFERGCYSPETA
jgi:ribosomal protein L22